MKEKEPKIASFRNATTIYMGHANGQDGEWDLFYSVHFEDRSAERKCSVVVYYDYDLRIRAFKKLYEQVMDASCLPCED